MSRLNFEIYQLRKSRETTGRKGRSLKGLKMHGMQLEADLYEKVYRSAITLWDRRTAVDILEELYDTYRRYFPDDYTGSAVGVSDVVILEGEDGIRTAYYCDPWSWPDVTEEWEASRAAPAAVTLEEQTFADFLN